MGTSIGRMAKQELMGTIRDPYRNFNRNDKGRVLVEFTAVTGLHRKLPIRLLAGSEYEKEEGTSLAGKRVYDKAIREAGIVVWEAADRICGRRLHAAQPHLVESMEHHGQLKLDSLIRERLLTASASTLDRQLRPIRSTAGSRRRRGRRNPMRRQVPVRTYKDWNKPPPGYLEIDRVAHCGGPLRGRRTTFSSTGPSGWPRRCWATASPFPGRARCGPAWNIWAARWTMVDRC